MNLFRRPVRVAVSLQSGAGRAYFASVPGADPVLLRWEDDPVPLTRTNILGLATSCCGKEGFPFLQFDVRTPYSEVAEENQILTSCREALGPKADQYPVSGWHVSHLADTNQGSNHRIFATLGGERKASDSGEAWDQVLPLELGLMALGEYAARKTGFSDFQLVLDQGPWIYSLIYLEAQPWHLLRVAAEPWSYARKRLVEHRRFISDPSKNAPIFLAGSQEFRQDGMKALGESAQPLPLPAGILTASRGPNALHFGLALASRQEEYSAHNLVSPEHWESNRVSRLVFSTFKSCVWAVLLAGSILLLEAGQFYFTGRELAAAKSEAATHEETLATLNSLRSEATALVSRLVSSSALWVRPVSVDVLLREISHALPASGVLDGFFLRRGAGGRMEISFRAMVKDWDQIRPMQEAMQRSPFFSRVDFTDQRKEPGRGVIFQGTCMLAELP